MDAALFLHFISQTKMIESHKKTKKKGGFFFKVKKNLTFFFAIYLYVYIYTVHIYIYIHIYLLHSLQKNETFSAFFYVLCKRTLCSLRSFTFLRKESKRTHHSFAGLGTTFSYVLNASLFCVLLKSTTFFYVLFLSFCQLMRPKRTMCSFALFS